MANVEDHENNMDQQRIDELQNQYFLDKLATVDVNRLKEARELLERHGRPSNESVERVRPKPPAANRLPRDERPA